MSQYNLTPGEFSLIKCKNSFLPKDVTLLSKEEIDSYNRKELFNNPEFRSLYKPAKWNITVDSFIVPTSDGKAINAYLVRNFKRRNTEPQALIIYMHDGGWTLGNMDKCIAICTNLCKRTGAWILAVDYRLAPQYRFPTAVEDCYDAYLWALTGARYWKLNPSRIYIAGSCTGANICAGVSRLIRDRKLEKPAGQILIEPVTDCRLRTQSMIEHKDSPALSTEELKFFISSYQREPKDILDPLFSPLLAKDLSRLAPALIIAAERDILLDDSKLYAQALNEADTPVKLLIRKNSLHGFWEFPGYIGYENAINAISVFVSGEKVNNIELFSNSEKKAFERKKGPVILK